MGSRGGAKQRRHREELKFRRGSPRTKASIPSCHSANGGGGGDAAKRSLSAATRPPFSPLEAEVEKEGPYWGMALGVRLRNAHVSFAIFEVKKEPGITGAYNLVGSSNTRPRTNYLLGQEPLLTSRLVRGRVFRKCRDKDLPKLSGPLFEVRASDIIFRDRDRTGDKKIT